MNIRIEDITVARIYEVYFQVEKCFTSNRSKQPRYECFEKKKEKLAALTREIFFPLEDKLHMFKPTCNFLFVI